MSRKVPVGGMWLGESLWCLGVLRLTARPTATVGSRSFALQSIVACKPHGPNDCVHPPLHLSGAETLPVPCLPFMLLTVKFHYRRC